MSCTCGTFECDACLAARVAHHADLNRGVGELPPLYPSFGASDSTAYARNAARDERRKRRRDDRLLGLTRG